MPRTRISERAHQILCRIVGSRERAEHRYKTLRIRAGYLEGYENIELRIFKEDFVQWFMPRDFRDCEVDRINNDGHYELGNIQLLSPEDHKRKSAKDRLVDGKHLCTRCHEFKLNEEMVPDKRRPFGVGSSCRQCEDRRMRERKRYRG